MRIQSTGGIICGRDPFRRYRDVGCSVSFLVGAARDWLDGKKPPRPADQQRIDSCDLDLDILSASGGLDNSTSLSTVPRGP
jgi:hypothetical protein